MVSYTTSCEVSGCGIQLIGVECDLSRGLPGLTIVGLPDAAVRESRERLRAAILNSGLEFPGNKRVTINLSPAGTKKAGTHLDLPMALGLLLWGREVRGTEGFVILGELSLDGRINPVKNALAAAIGLRQNRVQNLMLPEGNLQETREVEGIHLYPVSSLAQAFDFFCGRQKILPVRGKRPHWDTAVDFQEDFSDVKGRNEAKRAIEICVSGFHHLLMTGSPGCGKSMLAKRIVTVMPEMRYEEMLEVTKLRALAGGEERENGLMRRRPFRSPGVGVSAPAMVGGGNGTPRPGEITLAHAGVLFLDEMPEFRRDVLEALRQPLEDEKITISRTTGKTTYPCKFILVGARNPCPCGYWKDPYHKCTCTAQQIKRYQDRISGPILDRFDLFVDLVSDAPEDLFQEAPGGKERSSAEMAAQIRIAREIQKERYRSLGIDYNSQLQGKLLQKFCCMEKEGQEIYRVGCRQLKITRRGGDKLLRVARTIADLDQKEKIQAAHIAEALQFRSRENEEETGI